MNQQVKVIQPVTKESASKIGIRVCAYCRVSTDKAEQMGSYVAQKDYFESKIKQTHGWIFVGIYADYAKSGTTFEGRAGFQKMLQDCENGQIDLIMAKSITRFGRNAMESVSAVRKLKALNVGVYFEEGGINTLTDQSELLLTIFSAVAQAESESISTNERWSIQKKFLEGSYNVGNVAYGYCRNEQNQIVIDTTGEIVKFIYDEYLSGNGAWSIAKKLTQMRVQTSTGSTRWSAHTVRDMLKNTIYSGDMLYQKYYTTGFPFKQKANHGERAMYLIEDNHEPIVSKAEFENVQNLFAYRERKNVDNSKRYDFTGKIVCGSCGSNFRRHTDTKKNGIKKYQWCCKEHIESKDYCPMKAVDEELIKTRFVTMWNKLQNSYKELLYPIVETLERTKVSCETKEKIENLENQIAELSKQSRLLNQAMAKQCIDSAFYMEQSTCVKIKIDDLKEQIKDYENPEEIQAEIIKTKQLIELIKTGPNFLEEYSSEVFLSIVEKIVVEPNNELVFILRNGLMLTEYYSA
ncbi:recombinase family protein [Anaerotignum lactatifermentans]|uniref:Site-specific DNA recombinase n=1 Tax=Anaerotignum lactatifermentans DSM 14214 TaxID=1121323 RepID=A0A1M7BHV2_9FIRM|nr:recombinase family protein [Anaerotignum lactatifermentans]SHL54199.1 Site-specific DNA recombinase [[Clostridium] lactatifermentans DSM 14214] [Anaerotignum lactatifermentans DSM 14214]